MNLQENFSQGGVPCSMNEIKDYTTKAKILSEARRCLSSGIRPSPKLVSLYQQIPRDEAIAIYKVLDYFENPNKKEERTWADVVKYGKK